MFDRLPARNGPYGGPFKDSRILRDNEVEGADGRSGGKIHAALPSELTIRGGIEHIGDDLQEDLRIIESVGRDE